MHRCHSRILLPALLALCSLLLAAEPISFQACFDGAAAPPGVSVSGINNREFALAEKDGRQTMQVTRLGRAQCTFALKGEVPPGREQLFSLCFRTGPADTSVIAFALRNQRADQTVAAFRIQARGTVLAVHNSRKGFGAARYAQDQWQELRLRLVPGQATYRIEVRQPNGQWQGIRDIPKDHDLPVDAVVVANYPSGKTTPNVTWLDRLALTTEPGRSVANRENVALAANDAVASVRENGAARPAPFLNDGLLDRRNAQMLRLPATLEIELPTPQTVSTARLYSGVAAYRGNPSGECAATHAKVEVLSLASGQWREVADPAAADGDTPEGAFLQADFPPLAVRALRITITESTDTGRRASGPAPWRGVLVREVALHADAVSASTTNLLANKLEAEFRLPVYRDQPRAQLYAILDASIPSLEVELSFRERFDGRAPAPPRRVRLHPGTNVVPVDIHGWPDGEYRCGIRAAGANQPVKGEIGRLLRINHVDEPPPPADPAEVTGQKLFFPDGRYLQDSYWLRFETGRAETHRVGRAFLDPGHLIQLGSSLAFLPDGRIVVRYRTMPRNWDAKAARERHAIASLQDLDHWELHEGPPPPEAKPATTPLARAHANAYTGGADAIPKDRIAFYDPDKDGPIPLDQIRVQYAGYRKLDWGVLQVPPQSTWVLWKRPDGSYRIVGRQPLLQDNISSGEFEALTDSNDNHAGQWLSPDGKTLFFMRGHLLRRYPPFQAKYDNLGPICRILTIFSTQDGIHWKRHYAALPDEQDPPTAQHYGSSIYQIPGGNGLMIAYTYNYSALHQNWNVELNYSWDGRRWHRSPDRRPWVPLGAPGEWNFGHTTYHNQFATLDGWTYHLVGWGSEGPHFSGDFTYRQQSIDTLDADALARHFQGRDLEKWPYFSHYGSLGKLAAAIKTMGITPGITKFREDGWFALAADQEPGTFTTRRLRASGTLAANLEIAPGGHFEIQLLDPDGAILATKRLQQGGRSCPLFDHLPATPFQLRATMRNTRLYTLEFK